MFGVFLKAKLNIESNLANLQRLYLDLLNAPLRELIVTKNTNSEQAIEIIQEKIIFLESIKKEYESALNQYKTLSVELSEASETSDKFESQIDSLFTKLGIEIPTDLRRKDPIEESTGIEDTEDYENISGSNITYTQRSQLSREEEEEQEEELSDKENSQSFSGDSDVFFSPNIQIRKSYQVTGSNLDCYTPAVKSHSKPRLPSK